MNISNFKFNIKVNQTHDCRMKIPDFYNLSDCLVDILALNAELTSTTLLNTTENEKDCKPFLPV